jgi:hypothetical protein
LLEKNLPARAAVAKGLFRISIRWRHRGGAVCDPISVVSS